MATETQEPSDPSRYVARLIRSVLEHASTLVDQSLDAGGERRPDAGVTRFDTWMHEHEHGRTYSMMFMESVGESERLLRAAADMARSIAVLLESREGFAVSPHVLTRSLGEGVMRLCFLLDPDVPPARTMLRIATFQLATHEGNLETARAFAPTPRPRRSR